MTGWLAAAAQEPAPAPEPSAEPSEQAPPEAPPVEDPLEVIVYGELRVKQARDAVVLQLEDMGYDTVVIDRGDHTVYRHEAPWMGEVVLYDDGWMQVKRQPMHVEGRQVPWARRNTPVAWAGCLLWPYLCLRTSGATYGERKWRQVEDDNLERLDPKVRTWADRVADLAVERKTDALPDRMAALWERGEPLSGDGPLLATAAERRRALYEYWATRTDTVWGAAVRDAVEAFCRAVVMRSAEPFTAEELSTWASGTPERPFLAGR